jgi:DnaB-like helicase C terminal domain
MIITIQIQHKGESAPAIVAKHRDGSTGMVKLLFDSQFVKLKNLARGSWDRSDVDDRLRDGRG